MIGYLLAIACGFLWGISTPLMKYYSPQKQILQKQNKSSGSDRQESTVASLSSSSTSSLTSSSSKNRSKQGKHTPEASSGLCSISESDASAFSPSSASNLDSSSGLISNSFAFLASLTSNWKFVCSFLLNQLGSLFYTVSLHYNPITISVPICNSISLAVIVFIDCFTGSVRITPRLLTGLCFVSMGVVLCLLSSSP